MQKILKKMLAIMTDVDRIEKDGTNDFHKYKYASEKIIKERLHTALVKHGVVFYIVKAEQSVDTVAIKDKTERLTSTILTYRFCDVESGEYIEGQGIGQGQDPGDKGSYKAITGALKYILTTSFLIPTGDDPEADAETDRASAKATPAKPAPKKADTVTVSPDSDRRSQYARIEIQKGRQIAKTLTPEQWDSLLCDCFDIPAKEIIKELSPIALNAGIEKLIHELNLLEAKAA